MINFFVINMRISQLMGGLVHTQISLLYANVSPDDILLKQKLDVLATSHPNLKVKKLLLLVKLSLL